MHKQGLDNINLRAEIKEKLDQETSYLFSKEVEKVNYVHQIKGKLSDGIIAEMQEKQQKLDLQKDIKSKLGN